MLARNLHRGLGGGSRPSLVIPNGGTAGVSPVGIRSASGGSLTVTRAGTRWFRAGSSIAELAENTHCMEQDAAGDQFVSVYSALANYCPYSTATTNWTTLDNAVVSDSGVASPITGKNWVRIVEADTTAFHGAFMATTGFAQNQKCLVQALVKKGDRRYINLRCDFSIGGAVGVLLDADTGTIVDTGADATSTLHASGAIEVATGAYLLWLVCSDSAADPGTAYAFISMADGAAMSENSYDSYAGAAASYPLGMLFAGACIAVATGPIPIIETAAAAVTKNAEVLSLPITDCAIPGSVLIRTRPWSQFAPADRRLWSWYDADGDGAIELHTDSDGHVHLLINNGAGTTVDAEVTTAINDGSAHEIRAGWATDNCRIIVDGTAATDTSCAMPTASALDVSKLGASKTGQYFEGEFSHAKAWPNRRAA